jgi:molybdate transport system substrate-binding protein
MKVSAALLVFGALWLGAGARAEQITIAAAADLEFAMNEIVTGFRKDHPDDTVEVIYGSSGTFSAQLQRGAPYDLYFSADIALPAALLRMGLAAGDVVPYAFGRIVLWSAKRDASKLTLADLPDPGLRRIAIANPEHAPYGRRAEEALRAAGVWEAVRHKLVFGEDIAHTAQFARTGNAEVGIIALALALSPEFASKGSYSLIPDTLHAPLEQGYIVTRRAHANPLARRFADTMASATARAVMNRYGFILPGEVTDP